MSTPDNVARLREIKRLLDRIQQLPHIAAGAGNGVHTGFYPEPVRSSFHVKPLDAPVEDDAEPVAPVAPPPIPRLDESRALVPVQPRGAAGINPWLFVTATVLNTVLAAVLAVVITLAVARREPGDPAPAPSHSKEDARAAAEPAVAAPIELLPVGSPGEPLQLEALKRARLPLKVRPAEAMQASYILVLSGLPANATLSGATRMGSDAWRVPPGALGQLEIILPEWSASPIEIAVALRHANGAVAAQGRAWLAVPPPPVPGPAKRDRAAIKELMRSGDRLLGRGDIAAARAVYERAVALGSAQAALALGSTYDPGRLWSLGVFGMVANKERAHRWYQRADELGHPDAKERLRTLAN